MTLDPAIGWILALALALLLGAAAAHKLTDPARFRSVLAGYRLLPEALVPLAAAAVIGVEVLAAGLLVVPSQRARGAALAAGLLVVYALALGLNLLRGRTRIDCGCLGFGRTERISWAMVVRNFAFAALALVALLPSSPRRIEALDVITIGGSVACAAVLYAALTRLTALPYRRGSAS